jgi:hypothetical protein
MDVGSEFCLRLRRELGEIPEHRLFDRAIDVEPPALARNLRCQAEIEHRPVPGEVLSRRQALLLGTGGLAGEKAALACPALLGAGQLAVRRRLVLIGHILTPSYSCRCIADLCLVSRIVE